MESKMEMYKKLNAELIEQIQKMKIEQASYYREVATLRKELLDSHEALITLKSNYAENVMQLCRNLLNGLDQDGKYEQQSAKQDCAREDAKRTNQESSPSRGESYENTSMRNNTYIEQGTILDEQRNSFHEISTKVNDSEYSADSDEEEGSVETISSDESTTSNRYEETLINENENTEIEEMQMPVVAETNINDVQSEVTCDLYAIEEGVEEAESETLAHDNDTLVQQPKAAKNIQRQTRSGSALRESLAQRKSVGKQGAFDTVAPALSEITNQEANKLNRMPTRNMVDKHKNESKTKTKPTAKVPKKNTGKGKGKGKTTKKITAAVSSDDNIENQSITLPRIITELDTISDASMLPPFELESKPLTPNKTLLCEQNVTTISRISSFSETQINIANFNGLPSSTPNSVLRRAPTESVVNLLETTIENNTTDYKTTLNSVSASVDECECEQRRPRRQCRPISLTEVSLKNKLRNDKGTRERFKRSNK